MNVRKKQLLEKLNKAIYITSITSFLFAIPLFIYILSKSDYVSLRKNTETLAQLENKEEMKREIMKEIEQERKNKELALLSPEQETKLIGAISQNIKQGIKPPDDNVHIEKEKRGALERLEAERVAKRLCERIAAVRVGTATGTDTGAALCAGFLGITLFDAGVAYAACFAAAAATTAAAVGPIHDLASCVDVTASKLMEQNKEEKLQPH